MQGTERADCVERHSLFIIKLALLVAMAGGLPTAAYAVGIQTLDTVEVTDSTENLIGSADSSTEGTVTPKQMENRPILRTGELLETVPGLVISQHSGEGKANQYYLRGFNLDHGTDLATTVAGMPVNMPTHAHGQGYLDLNFLMPELDQRHPVPQGTVLRRGGGFLRCRRRADGLRERIEEEHRFGDRRHRRL